MNAELGPDGFADDYVAKPGRRGSINRRANQLVNVLIGDPALRPFAGLR